MIQECYQTTKNVYAEGTRTVVCEEGKEKRDLLVLKYMTRRLNGILRQLEPPTTTEPLLYLLPERHQRTHRVLLYRKQELLSGIPLLFVGFLSGRQKGMDPEVVEAIHAADRQIVEDLTHNTALLSYSSLQLRNGEWCNLVIMRDASAKARLRNSTLHCHAAHHLAHSYYAWIRLHNGTMHQGLDHTEMHVLKTKYYTFSAEHM